MSASRPLYAPFALNPEGRAHLIVTSLPAAPEGLEDSLANIEVWTVKHGGQGVPLPVIDGVRSWRSTTELLAQLGHRLGREAAGLRLYAIGSEAFVWDAYKTAIGAGLHPSEISLHRSGAFVRRVYCTHCRSIIEDVPANVVQCPTCEAHLFVRDHFSRRLAAFMGVKVDAEIPGEIPEPEVFTS
jgi:predicted RNA-binding Zn-ribbon protein involved in translation (DUF1610 family)